MYTKTHPEFHFDLETVFLFTLLTLQSEQVNIISLETGSPGHVVDPDLRYCMTFSRRFNFANLMPEQIRGNVAKIHEQKLSDKVRLCENAKLTYF